DMPLPGDDVFESIEDLVVVLERTSKLLGDSAVSSMRLVLNPEKMVIKEAQRAYTYLNLYGYAVDAVICNRIFPTELTGGYFDQWTAAQQENLRFVEEAFQPLPIFRVPMFGQEVMGVEMLRLTASTIFGDVLERGGAGDPTQTFYSGRPQQVFQQDGHYVLSLALPMVEKEEVKLHRSVVDELIVHIGNWKRNISLPIGLARLEIAGAKYEGDRLNILFALDEETAPTPQELQTTRWDTLKARLRGA
ncbi:MAG: ArsA family ATPase, partial [Caldilineaceae bacterium]